MLWTPNNPKSELRKVVMLRHLLRLQGHLPEITLAETVVAVVDAAMQGWFVNPNGVVDKPRFIRAFLEAWRLSTAPCSYMSPLDWISFFTMAREELEQLGFGPAKASETVTVYRGCRPKDLAGLAWTTDLHTAAFFAIRLKDVLGVGEIYRATVPRSAVLVDFRKHFPAEYEVVIDPRKAGSIYRLDLTLDEKWTLAREWLDITRARAMCAEAAGSAVWVSEPTLEAPSPPPPGGWPPLAQCVDETAPGYFDIPLTPPWISWPRHGEVDFPASDSAEDQASFSAPFTASFSDPL